MPNMYTLDGVSEHGIPIADCNVKPSQNVKEPRKIYKYKNDYCKQIKQETYLEEQQWRKRLGKVQTMHKYNHGHICLFIEHKHNKTAFHWRHTNVQEL